jgi:hypothetical protein
MAKVTVVCPTCATRLDLDAEHLGSEVQCGSCHEIFTAKKSERTGQRSDDDRPSRRRNDDDDDDEDRPRRRRRRTSGSDGGGDAPTMAIFGLILGIGSCVCICCCNFAGIPVGILGIVLSVMGRKGSPGLGIAGIVFSILGLVGSIATVALGVALNMGQFGGPNNFNNWNNPRPNNQWPQPQRNNFR